MILLIRDSKMWKHEYLKSETPTKMTCLAYINIGFGCIDVMLKRLKMSFVFIVLDVAK